MSPGNRFISGSRELRVTSHKYCRSGSLHSCECSPILVVLLLQWRRSAVDRRSRSSSRSSLPESDPRRPGVPGGTSAAAALSPRSREYLRLRVNARERQRMHDMNLALDALRRAMPYAQGPAVKKLSKMNTLLLARNYILLLTRTLDELRRLLVAGADVTGMSSRRHAHPDVQEALRSFVVRDLNAEHHRYVLRWKSLFNMAENFVAKKKLLRIMYTQWQSNIWTNASVLQL